MQSGIVNRRAMLTQDPCKAFRHCRRPGACVGRCVGELGHVSHVFMPVGMPHGQDCRLRSAEFLEPLALVNYGRPA
jgi:hypothetical protein